MASKGGLLEREKQLLSRHWTTLKRDVRMSDIVDHLIVEGVLRPTDWEDLKRKFNTESERTEEFLLLLTRKTSKHFGIFREALKANGLEHLAEKLDSKQKKEEKKVPPQPSTDVVADIQKKLRELDRKDQQKQKDLDQLREEHETRGKNFERKLATNLQQTNEEISKLNEALEQKEEEIEKLRQMQEHQESLNKDLQEENKKLQLERDKTQGELQLLASTNTELGLNIKKEKMDKDRLTKNTEILQKRFDRQHTTLQHEKEKAKRVTEELVRERTTLDTARKENEKKDKKIKELEEENEILSRRSVMESPVPSMSAISDRRTPYPLRREPIGISDSDDEMSCRSGSCRNLLQQMEEREQERQNIELQIKQKQIEQKYLRKQLRSMKGSSTVTESNVCTVQ